MHIIFLLNCNGEQLSDAVYSVDGKKSQEKKSRKKVTEKMSQEIKSQEKKVTVIKAQEKIHISVDNVVGHDFHVKIKQ